MTLFVVLAALMVTIALALMGWPFLKARQLEGRSALVALAVLAVVVPSAAALMYRSVSDWDWDPAHMAEVYAGHQSLEDMIKKLEERVHRQPEDVEGWLMLGRTRFVMNNYPASVDAFANAYKASNGQNLQAVIGYGETLALVDQSTIGGKAGELFEQALKMEPANPKALFYGGAAAAATGHPELARERWAQLIKQPLPDEVRVAVALRIGQLDQQMGRPIDQEIAKLVRMTPADTSAAVGPVATSAATGSVATSTGGPGSVTVHVRLGPALAGRIPAGTTLFVAARDPTQPGPPFAAKRFPAPALPLDVVLTDQDAMMPGRTIKDAHQLLIVARFSSSGRPMASSGDFFGEVPYDLARGAPTDLVIDKQVP